MQPGTRLNHYEIVAPLGEGGMGRVYRAEDTRLKRHVAIKVLPPELADDAERLARLQREAQVLAQLDHPNVAGVFGLEECQLDGRTERFLVMQLAEGETLAARLAAGALPLTDAVEVARQMALGLEAAHTRGIVHRDLKPANVMLSAAGEVKILDFGLAKAASSDSGTGKFSRDLSASPTLMAATAAGIILGTAPYMSPEQARGKAVDRRTDLWALGCVLYEMLAGARAFGGETATDVIAAVVQREPDWSALPASVPAGIRQLLRRLLAKDPAGRLRDAGDAALMLREAPEAVAGDTNFDTGGRRSTLIPWLVAAAALFIAAALSLRPGPTDVASSLRLSVVLPEGLGVPAFNYLASASLAGVALSPDATQMAFVAGAGPSGNLYLRRLDEFDAVELPGTLDAVSPFFSPDGRQLGFFAGNGLWRIELPGGAPARIAAGSRFAEGGTWTDDDRIVYTPNYAETLWVVPATGGEPRRLTRLDTEAGEISHRWPHALPGDSGILFVVKMASIESFDEAKIALADPATGAHRILLDGGTRPSYVDGYLLFARDTRLYAVPFDPKAGELRGAPTPVPERVITAPTSGNAFYALTRQGALAYLGGGAASLQARLYRLSASADPEPLPLQLPSLFTIGGVSADGRRLVLGIPAANDKLWLADVSGSLTRLSSGAANDQVGVWSPDERHVIFPSDRAGGFMRAHVMPLDGSEPARLLIADERAFDSLGRPAPGGGWLGYETWSEATGTDAFVLPIADDGSGTGDPVLVAGGPGEQCCVAPAPGGELIAYVSSDTGEPVVYVYARSSGLRARVTGLSAVDPAWSTDGKRLYLKAEETVQVVDVVDPASLMFGAPRPLRGEMVYVSFVVDRDGSVLAVGTPDNIGLRREIRVDLGWGQRLSSLLGEQR